MRIRVRFHPHCVQQFEGHFFFLFLAIKKSAHVHHAGFIICESEQICTFEWKKQPLYLLTTMLSLSLPRKWRGNSDDVWVSLYNESLVRCLCDTQVVSSIHGVRIPLRGRHNHFCSCSSVACEHFKRKKETEARKMRFSSILEKRRRRRRFLRLTHLSLLTTLLHTVNSMYHASGSRSEFRVRLNESGFHHKVKRTAFDA